MNEIELRDALDSQSVDINTTDAVKRKNIDIEDVNGLKDSGDGTNYLADDGTYKPAPQGAKGDKGDTGETGPQGPAGADGEDGYTPQKGVDYDDGADGVQGPQGETGQRGPQGPKGDPGAGVEIQGFDTIVNILAKTLVDGHMWISTSTGTDSDSNEVLPGHGVVAAGTKWLTVGYIRGPQGETGATGATGAIGPQGIQGPQGEIATITGSDTIANILAKPSEPKGATWIATDTDAGAAVPGVLGDGYVYDGVSTWENVGQVRGPQGPQGIQGDTGATGATGATGDTGPQGPQGIQGIQGPQGLQGDVGPQGPTGPEGPLPDPGTYVPATGTTASAQLPTGTNLQRDAIPTQGSMRFNTDLNSFEGHNGSSWGKVGGGATGGGGDEIFHENGQTVNNDYTLAATKNAVSAGPITIAAGVTVTISDGATWTIV